jgi:hypothetical protein
MKNSGRLSGTKKMAIGRKDFRYGRLKLISPGNYFAA